MVAVPSEDFVLNACPTLGSERVEQFLERLGKQRRAPTKRDVGGHEGGVDPLRRRAQPEILDGGGRHLVEDLARERWSTCLKPTAELDERAARQIRLLGREPKRVLESRIEGERLDHFAIGAEAQQLSKQKQAKHSRGAPVGTAGVRIERLELRLELEQARQHVPGETLGP